MLLSDYLTFSDENKVKSKCFVRETDDCEYNYFIAVQCAANLCYF